MKYIISVISMSVIFFFCGCETSNKETDVESGKYFASDKEINHAIIAEKSKDNIAYQKLLDLADAYSLLFCIREFQSGYSGKTQDVEQYLGQYEWNFLDDSDDEILDQYIESFVSNWGKLSPEFINKSGLKGILFVKDLTFAGIRVGGGFEMVDSILYIDIPNYYGGKEYSLYIMYHEFFHLLQNKFPNNQDFIDYNKWATLNPPGVDYYPGGALAMLEDYDEDRWFVLKKPDQKGFVSYYAMADIWHDSTELFCCFFIDTKLIKLKEWIQSDEYLNAKALYLIECLNRVSSDVSVNLN